MKAKALAIVMILALCLSMVAVLAPPATQPVQAATTWYVNPGESIQAAVDAASPGDTIIVRDGTYIENVDVNKDYLTIRSENGAEVTIVMAADSSGNVLKVNADYVTIDGFTITGATEYGRAGIYISGSIISQPRSYCTIMNNICKNNYSGIYLTLALKNKIENNICTNNSRYGISLYHSSDNTLEDNVCFGDGGVTVHGIHLLYSVGNILENNTCSENSYNGVHITYGSKFNILKNNTSENNGSSGIHLYGIDTVTYPGEIYGSNNNVLENNICQHNGRYGIRIRDNGTHDSILVNNICKNNDEDGIYLYYTSHNTLRNNTCIENRAGINLYHSSYNTIIQNSCQQNKYGIFLSSNDMDNLIYLNNFIGNNAFNAGHGSSSVNFWYSLEEITYNYNGNIYISKLGNFYDDYEGSDDDGNGIGENPYNIGENPYNIDGDNDNYPLIVPFENYLAEDAFTYSGEYGLKWYKLRSEERFAYPYVSIYAREYKVSPALIMAVIRQESNFIANANGDDWIGYMQVSWIAASDQGMPGRYTGTKAEWQVEGKDPDLNIKYGTRFLRILNDIFKDGKFLGGSLYAINVLGNHERLKFVLAAYNGGQGRIAQAQQIAKSNGEDPIKWHVVKNFLEDAGATPSKAQEIRNYVEQVIAGRDLLLGVDGQYGRRGYDFFLTIRVPQNPMIMAHLCSPAELRVYDSGGQVTGVVDGEVKNEIPYSVYHDNTVTILSPTDSYRYEVVGIGEGSYDLTITNISEDEAATFNATDIPTATEAIHEYIIDWSAISQGEEGVTVQIDSDGDGIFEDTITEDAELTYDEFMLQTATVVDFDPNTLFLGSKTKMVTAYIELPTGYDVGEIDITTIELNGAVLAEPKPTKVGDHDYDGIPDLMVKFDGAAVQGILDVGDNVEITVTGVVDGIDFEGSDTIRVIDF